MSSAGVHRELASQDTLTCEQAAARLDVLPEAIEGLCRRKFLRPPDAGPSTWWTATFDEAFEVLQRDGFGVPRRKSEQRSFPYATVIWRELNDETFRPHAEWRHRGERKAMEHPFGSPLFVAEWLQLERDYARRHPTTHSHNQFPAGAQQGHNAPSAAAEVVRQKRNGAATLSPLTAVRKIRRRASITQADIARIIRAAKQAGAAQVEVRLTDSSSVIVHLALEDSANDDEEIVL
jgi:hypothetical protein